MKNINRNKTNRQEKNKNTINMNGFIGYSIDAIEKMTLKDINNLSFTDIEKIDFASLLNDQFDKEYQEAENKTEAIANAYKINQGFREQAHLNNWKPLLQSYTSNYFHSIEIEKSLKHTRKDMVYIKWGKMFADNRKYIDDVKDDLTNSNPKDNKIQFSIHEQLLLLEYFGMLRNLKAKNKNTFLAGLLNRHPQQIRKNLSRFALTKNPISKGKTKYKNQLVALKRIVDSINLGGISQKIQTDIEKLDS